MPNEENKDTDDSHVLLRLGAWFSVAWLAAVVAYLIFFIKNWSDLRELDKLGSFLQGAFAPLAFVWLAIAVYLQRAELKQSTRALLLQADELKHVVQQHRDQTELLRGERTSQTFKDEERRLEMLIVDLLKDMSRSSDLLGVETGERERPSWQWIFGHSKDIRHFTDSNRTEQGFQSVLAHVNSFLRHSAQVRILSCKPVVLEELSRFDSTIESICTASSALKSDVIASRIRLCGLEELRGGILQIVPLLKSHVR